MPNANKIFKDMINEIKKNKTFQENMQIFAKRLRGESTEEYLKRLGFAK